MNEMDYVKILRNLREDADKTQTQIAAVLGTSQTMYARYERGANELPIPSSDYAEQILRCQHRLYFGAFQGAVNGEDRVVLSPLFFRLQLGMILCIRSL